MATPARKIHQKIVAQKFGDKPTAVMSAVDQLVGFLDCTLGPKIRHILVDFGFKTELMDDGVSIAHEFELEDEFEDAVISYVKEAAQNTDARAGDGTTSTMVMLRGLLKRALDSGKTYPEVRNELAAARDKAVAQLRERSVKCESFEDLLKVARTSMDDEQGARAVAEVVHQTGSHGAVSITDHVGRDVVYERLEGFQYGRGMMARGMANNRERNKHLAPNANFTGPVGIAVVEQVLTAAPDILPILQAADDAGFKNLTIYAPNVIGEAMGVLALAQQKGQFNVLAIPLPGQGEKMKDFVQDVCLVTGAKTPVGEFKQSDLGTCERVEASFDDSTLIGGGGQKEDIDAAIAELRRKSEDAKDPYEKEYYHQRQARLMGGVVMVKVGGVTETETRLRLKKVEDAINACKCALEDGISPGAGAALWRLDTGSDMLDGAMTDVHAIVLKNAESQATLGNDLRETVNVLTGEKGDFLDVGVVDATKVLVTAVENAVSIATILFSTSGIITSKRPE